MELWDCNPLGGNPGCVPGKEPPTPSVAITAPFLRGPVEAPDRGKSQDEGWWPVPEHVAS